MAWAENFSFLKKNGGRKLPNQSCELETEGESWVVENCIERVEIRDEAGNRFYLDDIGRCFVTEGPMRDIFGEGRSRVEIPGPLCQCLKNVVTEALKRRVD